MRGEEIAYVVGGNTTEYDSSEIKFVDVKAYPNGDPLITEIPDGVIQRVMLRPRSALGFMGGIFWIESMIERGFINPSWTKLIIPFVPGSRQDRLNEKGDALFTIKSVANMINRLNMKVIIFDPHSDVTSALINNCTVVKQLECLYGTSVMKIAGDGKRIYDGIISPDAGAEKKAGKIARYLKIPLIHAWKTRDVSTGDITGFGSEFDQSIHEAGKYLIVDDICDGGGTFIGLVDAIRPYHPNIDFDLSVTHGLFTKGTEELLKRFDIIYCTDSVVTDRPGIKINEICKRLLLKGRI